MKKFHLLVFFLVLFSASALRSETSEEFWRGKVIFVNQLTQELITYQDGKELRRFDVIMGDAKFKTPQGIYRVQHKDRKYWSNQYSTWMPNSLFFIWDEKTRMAIHAGIVPLNKEITRQKATHGCVHARNNDAEWLFDWAEEKATKIIIYGDRSQD
ncbi:MAG: L,D-transpeptidase [Parcubacteria group bacterium]|jgi:lipoprotein-anchoring transpeptidase ErfK/SrfK